MNARLKYPAMAALDVVDGPLAKELGIHRFDSRGRSKAQLFAVRGALGKQFAIVLGATDVATGLHPAKQTRILLERCEFPELDGIEPLTEPYQGARIKDQRDSKLVASNQVSCLVADEEALKRLLRWYAGATQGRHGAPGFSAVDRIRIEKSGADAGFDLPVTADGGSLIFRSSAFSAQVRVASDSGGEQYQVAVSDAAVGLRLSVEQKFIADDSEVGWPFHLAAVHGYPELHALLGRIAAIAAAVSGEALRLFKQLAKQPPDSTEAVRLVVQRVGQKLFRESLIEYWGGRCPVSGLDIVPLLRASHIKPWASCASDVERLDVFNGLLLAPQLDAAFDGGWITFSNDGTLLVAPSLDDRNCRLLGMGASTIMKGLTPAHAKYFEWHREKIFRNA